MGDARSPLSVPRGAREVQQGVGDPGARGQGPRDGRHEGEGLPVLEPLPPVAVKEIVFELDFNEMLPRICLPSQVVVSGRMAGDARRAVSPP